MAITDPAGDMSFRRVAHGKAAILVTVVGNTTSRTQSQAWELVHVVGWNTRMVGDVLAKDR